MNPFPVDIVDIVVKASALLAAAGLVDALLGRRGSAAARCLVWSLAFGGLLVLPIASYALPQWPVRIPVARTVVANAGHPGAEAPAVSIPAAAATRPSPAVVTAPAPAADDRTEAPARGDADGARRPRRVVCRRRADSAGAVRPGADRAAAR